MMTVVIMMIRMVIIMMIMMLVMIIMKTICRSANQNTAVQGLIGSTNAYIGLSDTATEVDDECSTA